MIHVVDYGAGDIGSVLNMLKRVGGEALSSGDARALSMATKVPDGTMFGGAPASFRRNIDEAWLERERQKFSRNRISPKLIRFL